jgi:LysM repeat protein
MRASSAILYALVVPLFIFSDCSREEEPLQPAPRPAKIVRPIQIPSPEKSAPLLTTNEEKIKIDLQKAEEEDTFVTKEGSLNKPKETLLTDVEGKTEDETGRMAETKSTAQEKQPLIKTESGKLEKETVKKSETPYYTVKKGDSLLAIAAKKEVYGDPFKWPVLYRYNIDEIGSLNLREFSPDMTLSEGMSLKIISLKELKERIKNVIHGQWVINILSVTNKNAKELNFIAIKLLKAGYNPYITRVNIKKKDWVRLRIGFFKNKADANKEGEKIKAVLNFTNFWITVADNKEIEEFGGY